eukprot:3435600-Rhodomonas_salina.10
MEWCYSMVLPAIWYAQYRFVESASVRSYTPKSNAIIRLPGTKWTDGSFSCLISGAIWPRLAEVSTGPCIVYGMVLLYGATSVGGYLVEAGGGVEQQAY